MSDNVDYEYFTLRAVKYRELATIAASLAATFVHKKLSSLYEIAAADLVIVGPANVRVHAASEEGPRVTRNISAS